MRTTLAGVMIAAMTVGNGAHALEPQAVLYFKVPLDGASKAQKKTTFGVQVNPRRTTSIVRKRPLMGLQFNDDGVQSWRIRNIRLIAPPKKAAEAKR